MQRMAARVDIMYKVPDTRAVVRQRHFETLGFKKKIKSVGLVDSYVIDARLTIHEYRAIARIFIDQLVQTATVNSANAQTRFNWAIEVGYLPGVTDNVGSTAKETIEDFLKKKFEDGQGVYSSQITFLSGTISEDEVRVIADSLYNPLI